MSMTANQKPHASLRAARIVAPLAVGIATLAGWEAIVRHWEIPEYVLPPPSAIWRAAIEGWPTLSAAWLVTLKTTFLALAVAVLLGAALAVVFSLSRTIEASFFPYAVILQVTPIVAIAPLVMVWVEN
jgi:NitT/TauT family transport system permease protein